MISDWSIFCRIKNHVHYFQLCFCKSHSSLYSYPDQEKTALWPQIFSYAGKHCRAILHYMQRNSAAFYLRASRASGFDIDNNNCCPRCCMRLNRKKYR